MGFNCLKATEPLQGGSLLFTNKFKAFSTNLVSSIIKINSAVSRAILELVYRFGIPNSDLQILKNVRLVLYLFNVKQTNNWSFTLTKDQHTEHFHTLCVSFWLWVNILMLTFWDVCKHNHEHEKQKTKEEKSLWGCKYGLLAQQIIRKQGEHIVEKSEWSVICLFYIE